MSMASGQPQQPLSLSPQHPVWDTAADYKRPQSTGPIQGQEPLKESCILRLPPETTAPPGLWLSRLCLPTTLMPAWSPSLTTLSAWGSLISLGLAASATAERAKPRALGCGRRELSGEGRLSCPRARHMSDPIWERILLSFLIWWQALLKKKKIIS